MNLGKGLLLIVLLVGCSLCITGQHVNSGPTSSKLPSLPALTNQQILQQALNGLFEQNKLADPTTIVECIDEGSAKLIVDFIASMLQKLAKGSVVDVYTLIEQVQEFIHQLPQQVNDCLSDNQQLSAIEIKYNIDKTTDISVVEKKYRDYINLHYLTFHKWVGDLNTEWTAGKYRQAAFEGAGYWHQILGISAIQKQIIGHISKLSDLPSLTNQEILQQALNGLFQQNWLPTPTTIIPCIDEGSAKLIVDFIGRSLQKLAKGSLSDLLSFLDELKKFPDQLPQQVKDCLADNQQLSNLGFRYGIYNTTSIDDIEKTFINYITLHYLAFHKWVVDLNTEWKAQKYTQSGFDVALYAHNIWKPTADAQSALGQFSKLMSFSIQIKSQIHQTLNKLFQKMNLRSQNTKKIADLV